MAKSYAQLLAEMALQGTSTSDLAALLAGQGTRFPDAGLGPVTNTTRAGRPNPMLTATQDAPRPADYMAPVAETLSIPMGAYGAGQLVGGGINAMRDADYASGAGQIALGMAGMLPMAPKGGKGIRAFHGSPHDFDKFSMDKIGTGEGTQAYGHGLYFAEREGVARSYRDTLSKQKAADLEKYNINLDGKPWKPSDDIDNLIASEITRFARLNMPIETLQHSLTNRWAKGDGDQFMQAAQRVLNLRDQGAVFGYDPGHMYEVRINADPADFLDWDKPLSQQSEKVREAFSKAAVMGKNDPKIDLLRELYGADLGAQTLGLFEKSKGSQAYNTLAEKYGALDWPVGAELPQRQAYRPEAQKAAGQALREAGIPGIRYLDQGSRAAGEGSSNYVVFDDAIIDIVKKYGIAGLALLQAAGYGADTEEPQTQ